MKHVALIITAFLALTATPLSARQTAERAVSSDATVLPDIWKSAPATNPVVAPEATAVEIFDSPNACISWEVVAVAPQDIPSAMMAIRSPSRGSMFC